MIALSLTTICKAVDGQLMGADCTISEVFTDSRQQKDNSLFVALIGDNFDAHQFVGQAEKQGAKALLVSKPQEHKLPQIVVKNTEAALGQLAHYVRQQVNPKVIGITGSAGKTSVKEMVASILRQSVEPDEAVLATLGNFNNHIGVPLTLLRLTGKERFAVIEMGANHQGEIAYCAEIARPDISVVNNVAPAHIEGFGSIQGVAKAKGEIYQALASNGVAVVNLDSDFASDYLEQGNYHKVTVSRHISADFTADNIKLDSNNCATFEMKVFSESIVVQLSAPGIHQVSNALVAAALSHSAGASLQQIKAGLEKVAAVKGRLNPKKGINGSLLIDDSYNASVASVKVAVDVLAGLDGIRILVLGDMGELGDDSEKYHRQVGQYAKQRQLDALWACGDMSRYSAQAFGDDGQFFDNKEALIAMLKKTMSAEHKVLIKGSRSARMEQVVAAVLADTQHQDEHNNSLGGGD